MQLFKEQQEGIDYILKAFESYKGFYLADRMGLGKTAQAIALIKQLGNKGKTLIIAPAYICYNWIIELSKWSVLATDINWLKKATVELTDKPIYLISYNMVTNDKIFKQLYQLQFDLIICDESHYLKTWNSKRSNRILGTYRNKKSNLLFRTKRILCMSGTPVLNRIEELYNVIVRIASGLIKYTKEQFIVYFSEHVEYTPWGLKSRGVKNHKELLEMIKPVFISRQKIEGLTMRFDKVVHLEAKGKGIQEYIEQENKYLSDSNISDLEGLLKYNTIGVEFLADLRQKIALSKIPKLLKALPDIIDNDRLVIYGYHKEPTEKLYNELKKKYTTKSIKYINGSVNPKKRIEMIKDYDILVCTISALKEGVNLVNSNKVIFFELDWTPANIEQAIARLHRRGQTENVFVYYFLYNAGIDMYISRTLQKKDKMIKKIIN